MKTAIGDISVLAEQKMKEVLDASKAKVKMYEKYLTNLDSALVEKGKPMTSDWDKRNIAVCLDNALMHSALRSQQGSIFEATYQDNIKFASIQLPLITALLPSLALNRVGTVQALDRRNGLVFYINYLIDQTKGQITSTNSLLSSKTGRNTGKPSQRYGTDEIYGEVWGTGNGSTLTFSGTAGFKPVKTSTFSVTATETTAGAVTITDDGAGNLSGTHVTGTINYTTGAYALSFATGFAPTNGSKILANYRFYMDKDVTGVGRVKVDIAQESVSAIDFKLSTYYELGAAIDFEKAFGNVLENDLIKVLGGEIRFEIDHYGIQSIRDQAVSGGATSPGAYSAAPINDQEWIWKKYQIIDRVEEAAININLETLRAFGNVIITGAKGLRLFRQLDGHWKAEGDLTSNPPTGPTYVGKLDQRDVVYDPFLPNDEVIVLYKGENIVQSGFIYCPYIPLFSTPTLVTADSQVQKGFMSSAGFKVVNAKYFTYFTITGI